VRLQLSYVDIGGETMEYKQQREMGGPCEGSQFPSSPRSHPPVQGSRHGTDSDEYVLLLAHI